MTYEHFMAWRGGVIGRMERFTGQSPVGLLVAAYRERLGYGVRVWAVCLGGELGLDTRDVEKLIDELSERELLCRMCGATHDDCYSGGVHDIGCDRLFTPGSFGPVSCGEEECGVCEGEG